MIDGHTMTVSVDLDAKPAIDDVDRGDASRSAAGRRSWSCRRAPQPADRRDRRSRTGRSRGSTRDLGGGMTVSVGRVRACPVLTHKFVALGHNTIRGAAGASILNAELMTGAKGS